MNERVWWMMHRQEVRPWGTMRLERHPYLRYPTEEKLDLGRSTLGTCHSISNKQPEGSD